MRTLTLVVDPEPTTLVTLTNPADPSLLTEGLLTYDFELNPATGHALVNQPGPRLPYFTLGGWPYAQYLNFRSSELALSINHHGRWVMTKYLIAAAAGAALVILAMNWVTKLEAAASHTMVVAQSRSITHDGMVDRSRKGDRLDFAAPATRRGMPTGCDAPFSPLAKFAPSNVTGRCLT